MDLTAIENIHIFDTPGENDQTDSGDTSEVEDLDRNYLRSRNYLVTDINSKSIDEFSHPICDTNNRTCAPSTDCFANLADIAIYLPVVDIAESSTRIANESEPDSSKESTHMRIISDENSTQSCDLSNLIEIVDVDVFTVTNDDYYDSNNMVKCVEYYKTSNSDDLDVNKIPTTVAKYVVDTNEYNGPTPNETESYSTKEFLHREEFVDENPPQYGNFSNFSDIDEVSAPLVSNDEFYSSNEIEYVEQISIEVKLDTMGESVIDENDNIPCRSFESPKYLKLKSSRNKLICNYCQKRLLSKNILRKHILKHMALKQLFNCTKCDRCFVSRSGLVLHEKTHFSENQGSRKFFCSHCDFKCTAKSLITAHTKIHDTEKKSLSKNTSIRNERISDCTRSKQHFQSSTSNRSLNCDNCDKAFARKSGLSMHKKFRTCEKSLNCTKCRFHAKNYDILKDHMSTQHDARESLSCKFCDKLCDSKLSLRDHLKSSHKIGKEFICDICDSKHRSKSSLIAHIKTHTVEKSFVCEICDKKFTAKNSLNRHRNSKHDTDRFVSDHCEQNFRYENILRRRIRKHTKQLNSTVELYKCSLCDSEFTQRLHLENHTCVSEQIPEEGSVGTGETYPKEKESLHLTCQICDFKVARESDLMDHFRLHTGETPFFCELCEGKFSRSLDLTMHTLSYHQ